MVEVETLIIDELEALSPLDERVAADWQDVLARVGEAPQTVSRRGGWSRRHRRLTFVLAGALLLIAVVLATPAFGLRSFILDVIGGRTTVPFRGASPAPTIVRREFADLGLGAPPGMAPQAIASEARTVTTIHVRGKTRRLWVAPTRSGGFCWQLEGLEGGCEQSLAKMRAAFNRVSRANSFGLHPELLGVSWIAASGRSPIPGFISAIVRAPAAERVTASFRDGRSFDLPFVFVSAPINAGFVEWQVPKAEQTPSTRLVAVTARDKKGTVLARFAPPARYFQPRPTITITTPRPRPTPSSPNGFRLPPPTPPFQRGSGNGVTVTIGANGVAVFDMTGLAPERSAVTRGWSPGCFKLEHDAAGLWVRGFSVESRAFGQTIKARFFGLKPPLDGCEIGGDYGHRWPDRFGSHSVVEIPLTSAGARYFTDRAAARDLAAFVRQRVIQKLRHETGAAIAKGLATYAPRVVRLASAVSSPRVGRIGWSLSATGVTFVERSATGRRFVVVVEAGKIIHQNLKPYAFVF